MPIITIANFHQLIRNIDIVKEETSKKDVLGNTRPFFSKSEVEEIALAIEILVDPSKLAKFKNCMKKKDTFTYLSEATSPAHHFGKDCDRLWTSLPNHEILYNGGKAQEEKVKKIRDLNKQNPYLIKDQEQFEKKIVEVVGEGITLKSIVFCSKGVTTFSNSSADKVAQKIRDKIRESEEYYLTEVPQNQKVIDKYKKATTVAFTVGEYTDNDTGYTQEVLKEYLKKYHDKFKQPLKDLLIEYNMAKHSLDLNFEKKLLEHFGFVPCKKCYNYTQYLTMSLIRKKVSEISEERKSSKSQEL